jgi:ADP-heptose:LPS heptosyltransferase
MEMRSLSSLTGKGKREMVNTSLSERIKPVRSMLAIHQGALGDFILALPVLRTLRSVYSQARSVIMGYPRILELVEDRFYAEEIFSIDQKGMATFFVRGGALDPGLTQFFGTFDLIVVFGKNGEGNLIGNLKRACEGRILHINPFIPWGERTHLVDHLLRELRRYRFDTPEQIPRLYLKASDLEWGKSHFKRKGLTPEERTKAIVIHPGSGSKKKNWPLEQFIDLVRTLDRHEPSRFLIVLGPAEGAEVQKAFEEIAWEMGSKAPLLLKGLSLLGLASIIEGCRLFIGNDSGITHMAAALGLPTLAIFGPSDARIWAPRGKQVVVVQRETPCCPCPQDKFLQCQEMDCMNAVEMEDVLAGLEELESPGKQ